MPPDFTRRTGIVAVALTGAATILGSRAFAKPERKPTMSNNENFAFSCTDEHDLSAADPKLPSRVRALIRIGDEGIARENDAAMGGFFHPDFRFHGPGGTELDRDKLWAYFGNCRAAFDDFTVTRQAIVTDGADYIACRTRFAGRFARPFAASPTSKILPNDLPFEYRLINIFRYAPDGRLAEEWAQYDTGAFMAQLYRPAEAERVMVR